MGKIQEILSGINLSDMIRLFNIQIAIAVFLIFLIFRGLFSQIIVKILFVLIKRKKKVKSSSAYKILSNFLVFLGLYMAIRILRPSTKYLMIVNTFFKIICIIFVTNIINSFITKDLRWFRSRNDSVNGFISRGMRGVVWIISGYIIVKELGYDLTGLMTSLGIGTVIISFAAQDTVKSLLSGIVILTDKPFEIGDYIEIGEHQGTVTDVTFRSTRIRALDNTMVTIPNSTITSEYIVNWDRMESRRLDFVLNLSMETTSDKIRLVVEKIKFILKNDEHVSPDTVRVYLDEIGSYSCNIRIYLYIDEIDYARYLSIKEKIYCDILQLVERENIDLAYPTQTVYVKNTDNPQHVQKLWTAEGVIQEQQKQSENG